MSASRGAALLKMGSGGPPVEPKVLVMKTKLTEQPRVYQLCIHYNNLSLNVGNHWVRETINRGYGNREVTMHYQNWCATWGKESVDQWLNEMYNVGPRAS